jgi:hypothetical protein
MKNKIKNQVPIYKKKNEFFFLKSIFCFEHYLVSFITKTQVRILLFNNLLNFLTLPLVRQIFFNFFCPLKQRSTWGNEINAIFKNHIAILLTLFKLRIIAKIIIVARKCSSFILLQWWKYHWWQLFYVKRNNRIKLVIKREKWKK